MFRHKADAKAPALAYASWFLAASGAGFTNAAAFVLLGSFVTHVTGFASLFGTHLAKGEGHGALLSLAVPGFFLAGAFIAGRLVVVREERRQVPHYDWAMGLAAACCLAAALLPLPQGPARSLAMALLCLSSGLQNAALSAASHRSVRVTHLTGLTTDLGLGLARLSAGGARAEMKLSAVRLGTIASFLTGSVAGAMGSLRWGAPSFLLPAGVCLYAAMRGRVEKKSV